MATPAESKLKPSEVLITGGRGYIGSHLLTLTDALVLDLSEGTSLQEFDPRETRYRDVKIVVHLADRRLEELTAENLSENLRLHENFLKKTEDFPRLEKVIFSSSCSVYGFSEEWISESSPVRPTSFYAESKLSVERLLNESSVPSRILRFGTAHGWSRRMRSDLLVNQFARAAARGERLKVFAPHSWRPYIHCRDFARVLRAEIFSDRKGLKNVVTENLSKQQILDSEPLRRAGFRHDVVEQGDPRDYRVTVDSSLLRDRVGVSEGIDEMMEHYRANQT